MGNSNSKGDVQPPEAWHPTSNCQQFNLVSPMSDISDPSLFKQRRAREMALQSGDERYLMANKYQSLSRQNQTGGRRRKSKVAMGPKPYIPRQRERDLPPPSSFYFPNMPNEESEKRAKGEEVSRIRTKKKMVSTQQLELVKEQDDEKENMGKNIPHKKGRSRRRAGLLAKTKKATSCLVRCFDENTHVDKNVVTAKETTMTVSKTMNHGGEHPKRAEAALNTENNKCKKKEEKHAISETSLETRFDPYKSRDEKHVRTVTKEKVWQLVDGSGQQLDFNPVWRESMSGGVYQVRSSITDETSSSSHNSKPTPKAKLSGTFNKISSDSFHKEEAYFDSLAMKSMPFNQDDIDSEDNSAHLFEAFTDLVPEKKIAQSSSTRPVKEDPTMQQPCTGDVHQPRNSQDSKHTPKSTNENWPFDYQPTEALTDAMPEKRIDQSASTRPVKENPTMQQPCVADVHQPRNSKESQHAQKSTNENWPFDYQPTDEIGNDRLYSGEDDKSTKSKKELLSGQELINSEESQHHGSKTKKENDEASFIPLQRNDQSTKLDLTMKEIEKKDNTLSIADEVSISRSNKSQKERPARIFNSNYPINQNDQVQNGSLDEIMSKQTLYLDNGESIRSNNSKRNIEENVKLDEDFRRKKSTDSTAKGSPDSRFRKDPNARLSVGSSSTLTSKSSQVSVEYKFQVAPDMKNKDNAGESMRANSSTSGIEGKQSDTKMEMPNQDCRFGTSTENPAAKTTNDSSNLDLNKNNQAMLSARSASTQGETSMKGAATIEKEEKIHFSIGETSEELVQNAFKDYTETKRKGTVSIETGEKTIPTFRISCSENALNEGKRLILQEVQGSSADGEVLVDHGESFPRSLFNDDTAKSKYDETQPNHSTRVPFDGLKGLSPSKKEPGTDISHGRLNSIDYLKPGGRMLAGSSSTLGEYDDTETTHKGTALVEIEENTNGGALTASSKSSLPHLLNDEKKLVLQEVQRSSADGEVLVDHEESILSETQFPRSLFNDEAATFECDEVQPKTSNYSTRVPFDEPEERLLTDNQQPSKDNSGSSLEHLKDDKVNSIPDKRKNKEAHQGNVKSVHTHHETKNEDEGVAQPLHKVDDPSDPDKFEENAASLKKSVRPTVDDEDGKTGSTNSSLERRADGSVDERNLALTLLEPTGKNDIEVQVDNTQDDGVEYHEYSYREDDVFDPITSVPTYPEGSPFRPRITYVKQTQAKLSSNASVALTSIDSFDLQSAPSMIEALDYRAIALGRNLEREQRALSLPICSPSLLSVDSQPCTSPAVPLLSEEARYNAAFLFSPSYAGSEIKLIKAEKDRRHSESLFSISTLESRNRAPTAGPRTQAITIPISESQIVAGTPPRKSSSSRKVRFSTDNEVLQLPSSKSIEATAMSMKDESRKLTAITEKAETKQATKTAKNKGRSTTPGDIVIPAIETKVSDLTDVVFAGEYHSNDFTRDMLQLPIKEDVEREGEINNEPREERTKTGGLEADADLVASNNKVVLNHDEGNFGEEHVKGKYKPYVTFKETPEAILQVPHNIKHLESAVDDSPDSDNRNASFDIKVGHNDEDVPHNELKSPEPVMHWSYSSNHGVTPMLRNKNSTTFKSASSATNSPFLRYKAAKNKFMNPSTKVLPVKRPERSMKKKSPQVSPKQKKSPKKKKSSKGLVSSRIAELDGKTTHIIHPQGSHHILYAKDFSSRPVVRTPAIMAYYKVEQQGTKWSEAQSTIFRRKENDSSSISHGDSVSSDTFMSSSVESERESPNMEHVNMEPQDDIAIAGKDDSPQHDKSGFDLFDQLMFQTMTSGDQSGHNESFSTNIIKAHDFSSHKLIEDEDEIYEDEDEDEESDYDISKILKDGDNGNMALSIDQSPYSEGESTDSSTAAPSVATLRQVRNSQTPEQGSWEESTVLSSIPGKESYATQELGDDGFRRRSFRSAGESTTLSSVLDQEKSSQFRFRSEATVKPTEQVPHMAPGSLYLSPVQRTPKEARKWRALAAAAKEKDNSKKKLKGVVGSVRKHLSERNTNIVVD